MSLSPCLNIIWLLFLRCLLFSSEMSVSENISRTTFRTTATNFIMASIYFFELVPFFTSFAALILDVACKTPLHSAT